MQISHCPPKGIMNLRHRNSKKQGNIGMGFSIAWFLENMYTVCVPITDSQKYDLIVEKEGIISRVQVKTGTYKTKHGIYSVGLSTKGGNKHNDTIRKHKKSDYDFLFILLENGSRYLIPSESLGTEYTINLGIKYNEFKV